jgi:hypothetical protein
MVVVYERPLKGYLSGRSEIDRAFLSVVVSARRPVRARHLSVHGLETPAIQARIERLRIRPGGRKIDDETLVAFAQAELARLDDRTSRGLVRLKRLADRGRGTSRIEPDCRESSSRTG